MCVTSSNKLINFIPEIYLTVSIVHIFFNIIIIIIIIIINAVFAYFSCNLLMQFIARVVDNFEGDGGGQWEPFF